MINVTVSDVINFVGGNLVVGDPRQIIKRIAIDTRTLQRGDFFIAVRGERYDAHDFLGETLERGASGVIVSRLEKNFGKNLVNYMRFPAVIMVPDTIRALQDLAHHYRMRFVIPVIGITGSNGKTTTKEMLASILSRIGPCHYTKSNFNNHIGLPLTLLDIDNDYRFVVVEMGASAPGEIKTLADIACPKIGIITNIASAHLKTYGSIEQVFHAKMELFYSLPEDGEALINNDDPFLSRVRDTLKCRATTFGINIPSDVWADHLVLGSRVSFTLHIKDMEFPVRLSCPGIYNAYNALAAAAAAWRLGIDIDIIAAGLENSRMPAMRNEVIVMQNDCILIHDAYNANPASMRSSLTSFIQAYPRRKKIAVLGDMFELGEFSEHEHLSLGQFLAGLPLDMILITGSYRRLVCDGAFSAGIAPEKIRSYDSGTYLLEDLKRLTDSSAAILFKASRGMAFEKIIEGLVESRKEVKKS